MEVFVFHVNTHQKVISRGVLESRDRNQVKKVAGKRYPKYLEPITVLRGWGTGKRN